MVSVFYWALNYEKSQQPTNYDPVLNLKFINDTQNDKLKKSQALNGNVYALIEVVKMRGQFQTPNNNISCQIMKMFII